MERSSSSGRLDELLADRAWVRRVARALVLDESRADDLEQEVWLSALRAEAPRSPRAWLGTVLRRIASNMRRDERRHRTIEARAVPPEPLPTPQERAERAEVIERVARAVRTLEEPYGTAIFLRYFEDMAPPEIARRLGVPLETVRTRLRRGLAIVRGRLDAEEREDRRRWALLLLPLVRRTVPGPPETAAGGSALAAAAGVLAMGVKTKVAVAAAFLLLLGAGAWLLRSEQEVSAGGGNVLGEPATLASRDPGSAPQACGMGPVAEDPGVAPMPAGPAVVEASSRPLAGDGASLRAEIVDARTGAPFEASRVVLTAATPREAEPSVSVVPGLATAAGLWPGRWRIRAEVPGRALGVKEFPVREGETDVGVRVEVDSTGSLGGRLDPSGITGLKEALVQVFRRADLAAGESPGKSNVGEDLMADQNLEPAVRGFRFKGLEPGEVLIVAYAWRGIRGDSDFRHAVGRAVVRVKPGETAETSVVLRPAAGIWLQWEGAIPSTVVELWIAEGDGPFERIRRCGGGGEGLNRSGPHYVAAGPLRWRARFLAWPLTQDLKEVAEPQEGALTLAEGEEANAVLHVR